MSTWRNIKNFPGYRVSDDGRVKSRINNRHGLGNKYHELVQIDNARGYKTVQLGRGNRRQVHRLVAEAFIPNKNKLPLVRHLNDIPSDNRVENLAWGTQTDNMQDCVKHGRLVGDTRAAIESRKRKVVAYYLDGSFYGMYNSVQEAADDLHVWPQHIVNTARGKLRQTGGWIFRYADEVNDV